MNELIEGVINLNTLQYHDINLLKTSIVILLAGVVMLKLLTLLTSNNNIKEKIVPLLIIFILQVVICAVGLISIIISLVVFINGIPVYQVTIDNNVSYTEFTDKYTVLEKNGLVYTIYENDTKLK